MALSPGSTWLIVSHEFMILCGTIPLTHLMPCLHLRWCQLVRHYNEPTFRTVTRIQPSTQEGLDAPWTTGAAQEIPVDRHLEGLSRGQWLPMWKPWVEDHWDKFDFSCCLHKNHRPLHLKRLRSLCGYERFAKCILKCSLIGGLKDKQSISLRREI